MNFFADSIPDHAMVGCRQNRRENMVAKAIQHLPHLGLSIPGRRRLSQNKDTKVGEGNTEVMVDSAIGSAPVYLTELHAEESAPMISTFSKAAELGASEPVNSCGTSGSPSALATPQLTPEAPTQHSAISIADFLGSSAPIDVSTSSESLSALYTPCPGLEATSELPDNSNTGVLGWRSPVAPPTTCESPSAPLASRSRPSRRRSLFALVPNVLRLISPRSPKSLQRPRLPDTPPTLELNPMALEELWPCPDYFLFKQQMPSRGINPKCKHYEDRSSMEEIFYLDLEESWTTPGLMVCKRRGPQYMCGAIDTEGFTTTSDGVFELEGTPLLPAYSPPTSPLLEPRLTPSSLSIHGDAEQIERDTFSDPFASDDEDEDEEHFLSAGDSSGVHTDSIMTDLSLDGQTGMRTPIKRRIHFSSQGEYERRHSLPL